MLQILGKTPSINVRKVLWLCAELDLPHTHEEWGAGFQSTDTEGFRALNPNATVPVLRDGDFVLWESNAICRYLARQYHTSQSAKLFPVAPRDAALVEQWMDWQANELNVAWRYAFMSLVRKSSEHTDAAAVAASVRQWNRLMRILDGQLATTGAYVTGPDFGLADIVLGLSVHRWLMAPIERPALPAIQAYYERLQLHPGFTRYASPQLP